MNSQQITHILGRNGFAQDTFVNLKPISEIVLTSNENLYPSDEIDFYFKSNEILLVYYKKKDSDGNLIRETKPRFCISYAEIEGFIFTTPMYQKKPYIWGSQM